MCECVSVWVCEWGDAVVSEIFCQFRIKPGFGSFLIEYPTELSRPEVGRHLREPAYHGVDGVLGKVDEVVWIGVVHEAVDVGGKPARSLRLLRELCRQLHRS